jgi:hypothetical protein
MTHQRRLAASEAEQATQMRQTLRTRLDASPEATLIVNRQGRVVLVNAEQGGKVENPRSPTLLPTEFRMRP